MSGIVDRIDACITNMQAIANSTRREGEEIAVHTADELAECRDVAKDLLSAGKAFVEDYLGYINSDDYDLPDPRALMDAIKKAEGKSDA
jgi:hypothetical protein